MNPLNNHRHSLDSRDHPCTRPWRCCWAAGNPICPVSRAGSTSSRACSGSACSTTSTSRRPRRWRMPRPTRAARAARASPSTSPRGRCSGSAGRRWPPGSAGAWLLGREFRQRLHPRRGRALLLIIGIGAWLGTIMLLNVWGVIWPNQKKILGIVPATDEEKAKRAQGGRLASRTNFVLSIPMLMCMASAESRPAVRASDAVPELPGDLRKPGRGGARARTSARAMSPRRWCPRRSACAAGSSPARRPCSAAAPGSRRPSASSTRRCSLTWHADDGERARRRSGGLRDRRAGARGAHGRAHRAQLPAAALGDRDRRARATSMPSPAPAARSSTPARRCRGCAPRRNTRCAAAAPRTTASACSTGPHQGKPHRRGRLDRRGDRGARRRARRRVQVEVEVETLAEFEEALRARARTSSCWTTSRSPTCARRSRSIARTAAR